MPAHIPYIPFEPKTMMQPASVFEGEQLTYVIAFANRTDRDEFIKRAVSVWKNAQDKNANV